MQGPAALRPNKAGKYITRQPGLPAVFREDSAQRFIDDRRHCQARLCEVAEIQITPNAKKMQRIGT